MSVPLLLTVTRYLCPLLVVKVRTALTRHHYRPFVYDTTVRSKRQQQQEKTQRQKAEPQFVVMYTIVLMTKPLLHGSQHYG